MCFCDSCALVKFIYRYFQETSQRAPIIVPPRRVSVTTGGSSSTSSADSGLNATSSLEPSSIVKSVIVRVGPYSTSSSSQQPPQSYSSTPSQPSYSSISHSSHPKTEPSRDNGDPPSIPVELLQPHLLRSGVTSELLLGRWQLTLELFGRVFIEDVGAEAGSIIVQLEGFPVKEARFRRDMEKIR